MSHTGHITVTGAVLHAGLSCTPDTRTWVVHIRIAGHDGTTHRATARLRHVGVGAEQLASNDVRRLRADGVRVTVTAALYWADRLGVIEMDPAHMVAIEEAAHA
jgi:hypothetical protein